MDPVFLEKVRQAAGDHLTGVPVLVAYAYGSRVTGGARPESDLDIGYYLRREAGVRSLPLAEEMGIAHRLSCALGVEVDLRSLGEAPLEFRGRVLEKGIRVYDADPVARVGLERDLLCRYHDQKPVLLRMHRERLARIAQGP